MIRDLVRVLFTPKCWIQNEKYSNQWEQQFSQLALNNKFVMDGDYVARLGSVRIWIGNHPYASFTPIIEGELCDTLPVRPKRATILKAMDRLVKDTAMVC